MWGVDAVLVALQERNPDLDDGFFSTHKDELVGLITAFKPCVHLAPHIRAMLDEPGTDLSKITAKGVRARLAGEFPNCAKAWTGAVDDQLHGLISDICQEVARAGVAAPPLEHEKHPLSSDAAGVAAAPSPGMLLLTKELAERLAGPPDPNPPYISPDSMRLLVMDLVREILRRKREHAEVRRFLCLPCVRI